MRRGLTRILLGLLALLALFSAAPGASASSSPRLTVSPSAIVVGESARLTTSGWDAATSVRFAVETPDTGALAPVGAETTVASSEVAVVDGVAQIAVVATREGELIVSVTGASPATSVETVITVTASTTNPPATASPSAAEPPRAGDDSAQAEPDPEAEGGRLTFVLVPLAAAGVIAVGAVFVLARSRRRRRGD